MYSSARLTEFVSKQVSCRLAFHFSLLLTALSVYFSFLFYVYLLKTAANIKCSNMLVKQQLNSDKVAALQAPTFVFIRTICPAEQQPELYSYSFHMQIKPKFKI